MGVAIHSHFLTSSIIIVFLPCILSLPAHSYPEAVSTLHFALENGGDLHVNELQKIRHYRGRSTEERRRRMPNHEFLLRAVRT